jgi:hypothetical protein
MIKNTSLPPLRFSETWILNLMSRQSAGERRLRGGPVHPAGLQVGGDGAAGRRGPRLPAAGVDDHVVQEGGQVRRRGALRGAARRARRGAGVRRGDRAGAGGARHRGRELVQAGVLGRGRGQRVRGIVRLLPVARDEGEGERGVRRDHRGRRLPGRRRLHAREARVPGHHEPHQGGVRQPGLPHQVRQQRHALRAPRGRRLARRHRAAVRSPAASLGRAR